MSGLQIAWFVLIGVLLAGYVILDGYDLGIGFWHLLSRSEEDRKAMRQAIAPYWDANEVWLITAGGALFAAFPMVYATVFSGFYLALLLVLFALMFRAVSIEFVEHVPDANGRRFWGAMFGIGSLVPALLFGVAMGNILMGLPLDGKGNYTGTFFDLLNPYSLLIGLTGFALMAMHGALFLGIGRTGPLADKAHKWAKASWLLFIVAFIAAAGIALSGSAGLAVKATGSTVADILLVGTLVVALILGVYVMRNRAKAAFLWSCALIVFIFATIAAALFPRFVPARSGGVSLTLANSSSSPLTLAIMLGVALVGVVVMLGYTIWVRRAFRNVQVEY